MSDFIINKPHKGIFRFDGKISIPVQFVVTSRLPYGEYKGLKLLAGGCTKEAVLHYTEKAIATGDENIKTNAGTVISICLDINKNLGAELKEAGLMNEVMKDCEIAEMKGKQEGIQEGINDANERVATDMLLDGKPFDEIKKYSKLAEDTILNLAKTLGVAII